MKPIEKLLYFVKKAEKSNGSPQTQTHYSIQDAMNEFYMHFPTKGKGKNSEGEQNRLKDVEFYTNNKDKDTNEISLVIPAKTKYVILVRLIMSGIGASLSINLEDIEDLKIAITEIISNVVKHAYPGNTEKGKATIVFTIHADKLSIVVTDKGRGFDTKILKSSLHAPSARGKGLGLFLIHSLVDEVKIHSSASDGTEVRMVKYLGKGQLADSKSNVGENIVK